MRSQGRRARRCTGAALAVAVALLEATARGAGGRALLFTAGPCTSGPGAIVGEDFSEAIRTHHDMAKGRARHYGTACEFYDGLAHRLIDSGQALDVFAACLDQVRCALRAARLHWCAARLLLTAR
jgi:protein transport protein SEC23